ncbi:TetR family transcriptional regulator [Sphingosinicella sp. LHD-64]|uniref:TetR/AcrR family transcriptional regulator n=1 Tax=Sphingosinicella sp. LHD-64 TaxID=3072139 RepID=UPI00280DC405|nr:TetR family transcriptional regulator [Sphingosinicella sp. LHD-64]MDQ8755428.1 TetR family transcriptional regulator [Sphingosinicella sp. LHD-64]
MSFGEMIARRRRSALDTRASMLNAARQRFLRESYENVGLRDIAKDVGVDVALVSRYFGSKEELFREVLHGSDKADKFQIAVGPEELACYLTAMFDGKEDEEQRENLERLVIVLRSSSSPQAAAIVHEAVHEDVLQPIADVLGGGEEAEIRAAMVLTILLGGAVMRSVMSVGPDCGQGPPPAIRRKLYELFRTALKETPDAAQEGAVEPVA